MTQRLNPNAPGNKTINAMHGLGQAVYNASLDRKLIELVNFRVSQINGCAYCLDMHAKNLRAGGETEQRLYVLHAWREAPFYSERERAALAWAEALTKLNGQVVADDVYEETRKHFSEVEIVDLTMDIITINSYNRINLAFGADVGSYQLPSAQPKTAEAVPA